MDKVYVCLIIEDIKYDNQGRIIGVYEDYNIAIDSRDKFNDKYSHMVAGVMEQEIIRKTS